MLRLATVYAYNGHEDNHSFIGHLSVYKGGFADIETGLWNKNKWDYLYWWTAIQELSLILSTKIYDMFIIGLYHNLCNLISSCNLRKNRFLPVKKGRICSRQRKGSSIYLSLKYETIWGKKISMCKRKSTITYLLTTRMSIM